MSKMSQLNMELTESAADLGFESIEEAEAHGFIADYNTGRFYKPYDADINEAYKSLELEKKRDKEAKQLEMVYKALQNAKDIIELTYRPDGDKYCRPSDNIKDEKIKDYFYKINEMCCELADRNVMTWQKEDQ